MINNTHTVAFLPGWGFSASIWHAVAKKMPVAFTPYFCELPKPPLSPYTPDTLIALVEELNDNLPENTTLVGWSLGGLLATLLCKHFPEKYKKLILVASTPTFTGNDHHISVQHQVVKQFQREARNNLEKLLQKFMHLVLPQTEKTSPKHPLHMHLLSTSRQENLLFYLELLIQTDLHRCLSGLTLPTLQIYGSEDNILPRTCAARLTGIHAQATTHLIHGAGHAPFFSHLPEFLHHFLPFLERPL
ncbi:MAG TPA: alpha/beta fold hydrolase [Gammaproteobacteria bacterium]|jgi:pimeloyl-[acyl-carrier protein] methyl ester esterase|nr:alpha/beta fold hydrolase [Gammaproteobacteria bacterium]